MMMIHITTRTFPLFLVHTYDGSAVVFVVDSGGEEGPSEARQGARGRRSLSDHQEALSWASPGVLALSRIWSRSLSLKT